MKLTIVVIAVLLTLSHAGIRKEHPCRVKGPRDLHEPSKPIPKIPINDLPTEWNWGSIDGKDFLTIERNQHIPQYCGSCWAFAATSALSDRIKIARDAAWPDINIAPQVLISCDMQDYGCEGGDA